MREQDPATVDPSRRGNPGVEPSELHVASPADVTRAKSREERLDAILRRADLRDRAAEIRDRDAEGRDPGGSAPDAAVDRDWAGRDRDRAAEDRADLLALLRRAQTSTEPADAAGPRE
jgi:hypothetical protein